MTLVGLREIVVSPTLVVDRERDTGPLKPFTLLTLTPG